MKKIIFALLLLNALPVGMASGQTLNKTQDDVINKAQTGVINKVESDIKNLRSPGAEPAITSSGGILSALEQLEQKLPVYRQLYQDGLISKREIESYEARRVQLLAEQNAIKAKNEQLARIKAEAQRSAQAANSKTVGGKPSQMVANARTGVNDKYRIKSVVYKSAGALIPKDQLSQLKEIYFDIFKEDLPVSANGQSATHNRLGWNHQGRYDVAVSPNSQKGQTIIKFLQDRGIAFLAFTTRVPGMSTGPHIHIGLPSSRLD